MGMNLKCLTGDCHVRPTPASLRALGLIALAFVVGCSATSTGDVSTCGIPHSGVNSSGSLRDFNVSLIELIARPRDFHGQRIMAQGTIALGFEHSALYLHREDYDRAIYANSVWVTVPEP